MSDLHLGYREYGKFERVEDFHKAAMTAANLIVEERPDFVVIPGDIFHHARPYPIDQRQAISVFDVFRKQGIPVFASRGNHDASHAWTLRQGANELDVLQDLGLVRYLEDDSAEVKLDGDKTVRVWGLGYHGSDVGARLASMVKGKEKILSNRRIPNVLLAHEYLDSMVPSAEISESVLDAYGFDYVALGHFHQWWLNRSQTICCTGSTEHVSALEWDEPERSVAIVSLPISRGRTKPSVRRLNFKVRPKIRRQLVLGTCTIDEATEAAKSALSEMDLHGAIVRIDIKAKFSDTQGTLDVGSIVEVAKNALHVMIVPEIEYAGLEIREDLSDNDLMRQVFIQKLGVPEKEAARWVSLAEDMKELLGESLDSKAESSILGLLYSFSEPRSPGTRRRREGR